MALLDGWKSLWSTTAVDEKRWVVLDVETSGLDTRRDRLLAVAALAVHFDQAAVPRLVPADSFEVILRQDTALPDKANILLHGIGLGAQRVGVEPRFALQAFADFAAGSPLIAFHAAFDRSMIERAMRSELGQVLRNPWLDLQPLAAAARPELAARSLDEWMQQLGVNCEQRHQAAADTQATAELLLKLWPAVRVQMRGSGFAAVARLARSGRWLQLQC